MTKKQFPLAKVYMLIESGPVVLVTTARKGKPNIMTLSWSTMIDFNPPVLGCVVGDKSYTFDILKTTKECVVNIPTVELLEKVVACGNASGRTVDKFKNFHLTPVASSRVKAPRVDECYAQIECKVIDDRMAARYNLFILEVVRAWIDPRKKNPRTIHHRGKGVFMVSGKTIHLPSGMK